MACLSRQDAVLYSSFIYYLCTVNKINREQNHSRGNERSSLGHGNLITRPDIESDQLAKRCGAVQKPSQFAEQAQMQSHERLL